MELGEDKDLKFMMACADYIPPLQAFQGSCKPVWLFVAAGQGTIANKMFTIHNVSNMETVQARLCP